MGADLVSSTPSRAPSLLARLTCTDQQTAAGCSVTYTPRVFPGGGLAPYDMPAVTLGPGDTAPMGNHSVQVQVEVPFPLPNGGMQLVVTGVDGAGNAVAGARGVSVLTPLWVRDTVAPDTQVAQALDSAGGVAVGGSVRAMLVNSTTLHLVASCPTEQGVASFNVSVATGAGVTWWVVRGGDGVVTVQLPEDGIATVAVVGVCSVPMSTVIHGQWPG